ncbi:MAG: GNAT family N-acetyltransferase [Methanomicrobiales archaeon]|nr:GNAT family N-acetyltransferase [Methanomicrobiales archaeon]NYT21325.1 GNAT family N-acetyltransferase [Methanomicrobiales archaeon]
MVNKILLPTDFSEYARMTTHLVTEIPDAGEVILLHVLDGESASSRAWLGGQETASLREYAERSLHDDEERLTRAGIPVKAVLVAGDHKDPAAVILGLARREAVDLIIIGARGKGLVEGFLLGSVSSEILRHATTSVLLVRHPSGWRLAPPAPPKGRNGGRLFSRVLFPVDFSKPCDEGFAFLRSLPGVSEMILLHVITRADTRQELEAAIQDSYQELQSLWNSLDDGGTKVTILIRFGRPAEMISRIAEKEKATLIFMPRFGASDFIKTLPIGSTAREVADQTRIPLFLFYPEIRLEVVARELDRDEFPGAEEIWRQYHQQTADPGRDRVFGVLVEGILVTVARCRRHPGGLEVDGVFTLDEFRERGYAREVMEELVSACGREPLYMHSTLPLVEFYRQLGFEEIGEDELPPGIKSRFDFAMGELDGTNVQPMMRPADRS